MGKNDEFWKGEFGDLYIERNLGLDAEALAFFSNALRRCNGIDEVIELGCGSGRNLKALSRLGFETWGVEINEKVLHYVETGNVIRASLLDFTKPEECQPELSFTRGVLIHIAPEDLQRAYERLYECTSRYILIAEYYAKTPTEIEYRGHAGKLWRRDFAGEILDKYQDLKLIDYGFVYDRDPMWPQDSINWFLMEKR